MVSVVITPASINPAASGSELASNKNPVAPINSALLTLRASKYIATGGDQIELRPPKTPENNPTPICQPQLSFIGNLASNICVNENDIIAIPMDVVSKAFGYDKMKNEVMNMLTTIENANNQYLFAMKTGFSHRAY